jgi:hypothetical protein
MAFLPGREPPVQSFAFPFGSRCCSQPSCRHGVCWISPTTDAGDGSLAADALFAATISGPRPTAARNAGRSRQRLCKIKFVRSRLSDVVAWAFLLLFGAVTILWIRSYWAADSLGWRRLMLQRDNPGRAWADVTTGRGGIGYIADEDIWPPGVDLLAVMGKDARDWNGGFGWRVSPDPPYYPFGRSPPRQFDRFGFFFIIHHQSNAGPPWATDGSQLRSRRLSAVVVPFWFLLLVIGLWPAVYFVPRIARRFIAARRMHLKLCTACGYDLRATPDCCPECGMIPPK